VNLHNEYWWEDLKGRDHLGDLDVDGKNIEADLKEGESEDVAWIHETQNRVECQAVVNTAMNFHVP
jgi:hypothetical protein